MLLLHANRVVSIDRLAGDLYGDAPPVTAVTQIHRQVSELRQALGSATAVETLPPGYRLRVGPDDLDLERFERLTADGTEALARGDAAGAAIRLRDALGLWRGEPLADLAFEPFAAPAIARLQELYLGALEARIEADLRLGATAGLAAELDGLVAEHPLRERLHGLRMLVLYRTGRQQEALEAFRTLRRALVDAFGIEPTHRSRSWSGRSCATTPPSRRRRGARPRSAAARCSSRPTMPAPSTRCSASRSRWAGRPGASSSSCSWSPTAMPCRRPPPRWPGGAARSAGPRAPPPSRPSIPRRMSCGSRPRTRSTCCSTRRPSR